MRARLLSAFVRTLTLSHPPISVRGGFDGGTAVEEEAMAFDEVEVVEGNEEIFDEL